MVSLITNKIFLIIISLVILSAISSLFIFTDISITIKKIFTPDNVLKEELPIKSCTDPEQFRDYFTKGVVQIMFENDFSSLYGDECYDSMNLNEYYCEDNNLKKEEYNCISGCYDGACVSPQDLESVTDSNISDTCTIYDPVSPLNAISQNQHGSFSPINSIDFNVNTHWYGSPFEEFPKWIYFDLGEKKCINQFDLYFFKEELPINITIQASQDTLNWVSLMENLSFSQSINKQISFPQIVTARYIRIIELSSGRNYGSLSDIRFNVAKIPVPQIDLSINQTA
ncbi:MAG: discoidin domain-containing protein [Nanoarchaeota archaeon]